MINDQDFRNPPVSCRSLPFWAWNDRLEKAQLFAQIEAFHEQGFGGFFMHSREGLETPYLSPEWDACIMVCVEEAQKRGMEAWLYDEDRWPSGSCSGMITSAERGDHGLKGLVLKVEDKWSAEFQDDRSIRALYAARVEGDRMISYRRLDAKNKPDLAAGESLLVVRFARSLGSVWFNGSPPPDNLSFGTVKAFLDSTHEHYRSYLEPYFGTVVPGIFTDEPSLADRHAAFGSDRSWIPWSQGMEEFYTRLTDGDIYETLPFLFFDGEGTFESRHAYWNAISLRYEQCFSMQIGAWCREHGIIYTGHFLQEDKLGLSTRVNGSIMCHYTHQEMPGIDLLGERIDEYLTVKQVSSVAHQYGKARVICETYAGAGWDFSFAGQKWVGEWLYLMGVTNRCQHLSLYSLRGNRKRDYPQSFNTHSASWEKLHIVEEYFARLSAVMQRGEVIRPILLVHPQRTVWGMIGCSPYGNPIRRNERDVPKGNALGERLNSLIKAMESASLHADLGDETLMARDGSVEGAQLRIALASYSVVVLPYMQTMAESTNVLLTTLLDEGGEVIILGDGPLRIDGVVDGRADALTKRARRVRDEEALLAYLSGVVDPLVSIVDQDPAIHTRIQLDGPRCYVYILNTNRTRSHVLTLSTSLEGARYRMDLMDGSIEEEAVERNRQWQVTLKGGGSALYLIDTGEPPMHGTNSVDDCTEVGTIRLDGPVPVTLSCDNVLTLDRCSMRVGAQPWSDVAFTWEHQRSLRRNLGMRDLDTDEIEQRYLWMETPHPNDGVEVSLSYRFEVKEPSALPSALVIEDPHLYTITVNGNAVNNHGEGSFLDHSFSRVPITGVHLGVNEIVLSTRYTEAMSLEDIFVVGSFGVDMRRRLIEGVTTLPLGSWTEHGLPHYPGNVTYHFTFCLPAESRRVLLRHNGFAGVCMSYEVNGATFEVPWETVEEHDITQAVRVGENSLDVTVFGSPRNMLGPLHLKEKSAITNPLSFYPKGELQSTEYHCVASGLMWALKVVTCR